MMSVTTSSPCPGASATGKCDISALLPAPLPQDAGVARAEAHTGSAVAGTSLAGGLAGEWPGMVMTCRCSTWKSVASSAEGRDTSTCTNHVPETGKVSQTGIVVSPAKLSVSLNASG